MTLGRFIQAFDCWFEKDVYTFQCPTHGTVLGSTLLFMCGVVQTRVPLYVYWLICDCLQKYTISIYELGQDLIKTFEY